MPERATMEELLDFANQVREAGGGNPLDALMPSVPQDSSQCLIARNLNFNCRVCGTDTSDDLWQMEIDDDATVVQIAKKLNLEIVYRKRSILDAAESPTAVLLPERIGQVASDFDATYDLLDDLYDSAAQLRYEATGDWYGDNKPLSDYVKEAFESLNPSEQAKIREFLPYIEESEREAYKLATAVIDGKIIL